jgi:hypothetical protein
LLDCDAVRDRLSRDPALDLAVVVSDIVYAMFVRPRFPGLDPDHFVEVLAVVAVLAALVVYVAPTLDAPLLEKHSFRQTQTAWTARVFHEDGIDLLHPKLPVFGEPFEKNGSLRSAVARNDVTLGLRTYSRQELERLQSAGETIHIRGLGLTSIAPDVSPDLARATIESIVVLGALNATPQVKAALADRLR